MAQRQIEKSAGKAAKKPDFANKELAPDRDGINAEMRVELNILNAFITKYEQDGGENAEIVRLIESGAGNAAKDKESNTALQIAAAHGHARICALIMKEYAASGGDIKELIASNDNDTGTTALQMAAANIDPETCALLIGEYAKAGGNVKELIAAKAKDGRTTLHLAAFGKSTQSCALLIDEYAKAGGNVTELIAEKTDTGQTALHEAAQNGCTKLCALLLANGADVKAKASHGATARHTAAAFKHVQTAQFLESMESLADMLSKEKLVLFMKSFTECISPFSL